MPSSVEIVICLVRAALTKYIGDGNSNRISLLWKDERINRAELYLGLLCILLNLAVILCTALYSRNIRRAYKGSEVLGCLSFSLLVVALWPIWGLYSICILIHLYVHVLVMLLYFADSEFSSKRSQQLIT